MFDGSVIRHTSKKARAHYVEDQEAARRSIDGKRLEKEGSRLIFQMLYGAPPICKSGYERSILALTP